MVVKSIFELVIIISSFYDPLDDVVHTYGMECSSRNNIG